MRARVLIRPKAGILDPQGQAVERALPALGFDGVRNVHIGRLVELDVEDLEQLPAMCEQLLANPLIEDYEIVGRFQRPDAAGQSQIEGPDDPRGLQRPDAAGRSQIEGPDDPRGLQRPDAAGRSQIEGPDDPRG
jgi:phosphoribosylformylglycinamidine synthase subunit PurS